MLVEWSGCFYNRNRRASVDKLSSQSGKTGNGGAIEGATSLWKLFHSVGGY